MEIGENITTFTLLLSSQQYIQKFSNDYLLLKKTSDGDQVKYLHF